MKRSTIFTTNITRMGNMRNMADIITSTRARKVDTRRRDTEILLDARFVNSYKFYKHFINTSKISFLNFHKIFYK